MSRRQAAGMECREVQELLDAIAGDEVTPDAAVSAHLGQCARCAASLALARRIDRLLAQGPAAPAGFVPAVMRRVRHERWRSEQFLDIGFNLAIGFALITVVSGIWLLLHLTGLEVVTSNTAELMAGASADALRRITPVLPLYGAAAGVLVMALGVWWWVERDTA